MRGGEKRTVEVDANNGVEKFLGVDSPFGIRFLTRAVVRERKVERE